MKALSILEVVSRGQLKWHSRADPLDQANHLQTLLKDKLSIQSLSLERAGRHREAQPELRLDWLLLVIYKAIQIYNGFQFSLHCSWPIGSSKKEGVAILPCEHMLMCKLPLPVDDGNGRLLDT